MRKVKQVAFGSDVYALLEKAHLSEVERHKALDAMRTAERFSDAVLWVQEKVAAIGTWFLKPSLKH